METFWQWLIGEAGAGWIIGILGLISGIYAWIRRDRPPKIIIQEIEIIKLLDIHPSHHDRLKVYFASSNENRRISNLEQRKFVIYNSGTKDVSETINIELHVQSRDEKSDKSIAVVLEPIFDEPAKANLSFDLQKSETIVNLELPYLNSFPVHKQRITGYILSEGPVNMHLIKGNGKGWSSYFIPLSKPNILQTRIVSVLNKVYLGMLILTLATLIPALVIMFKDPVVSVYINPTPTNINLSIQQYADRMHKMESAHLFQRFLINLDENTGQALIWLLSAMFLIFLSSLLESNTKRIAHYMSRTLLGLQSVSKLSPSTDERNEHS